MASSFTDPTSTGPSPTPVDLEVENVMSKRQQPTPSCSQLISPCSDDKHRRSNSATSSNILLPGLANDGTRKSAFSPYKPTTVLTNLQRGNIETQTPCLVIEHSVHQLAGQGELIIDDITNDTTLDDPDDDGLTPLMWAAYYGQLPMVIALIARRVNLHAETKRGETALLLASYNGHSDVVKLLLENNMDVDHTDEQGNSALMYAAFNNHSHCAQELLQHNADITKESLNGETAYNISITKGSRQVQAIIERHILHLLENR
ncbi:hypothetical protein CHUAL_000636 [Chamberlinius hualienensis]